MMKSNLVALALYTFAGGLALGGYIGATYLNADHPLLLRCLASSDELLALDTKLKDEVASMITVKATSATACGVVQKKAKP